MWRSYWDDPSVLDGWPLLRRRRLSGSDVRIATTEDGIAVRIPADGFESVLIAGARAADLLGDPEAVGIDRVLVMNGVAPAVREALGERGFEERRSWSWYSVADEPGARDLGGENATGRAFASALEPVKDMGEIQTLLLSSYPLSDRRMSANSRWWGVHREGILVAAAAVDTWRGHARDGSIDWNSHVRSVAVHRDYRGEGLGSALFDQLIREEWRRTEWVQWTTWSDNAPARLLMEGLGLTPVTRVTNFRPLGTVSETAGYPGAESA